MGELATIEQIQSVSPTNYEIAWGVGTKIKDLNQDFSTTLTSILISAFTLSGFKGQIDNLQMQDISKMILSRFKTLSLQDIYLAFQNERYGQYGDQIDHFNLFNAVYVGKVLSRYQKWQLELRKIHKKKVEIQEVPKPTPEEVEKMMQGALERCRKQLKETGDVIDAVAYLYDWLEKKGEITLSKEKKESLMIDARVILKKEQKLVSKIRKETNQQRVINEAKKLALIEYLK